MAAISTALQTSSGIRSLKELPGPKGVPLLGNARQIRPSEMHLQLEAWVRDFGERYRIALGPRPFFITANPDDIAFILKNRPDGFRRFSRLDVVSEELGIMGLFSASGDRWKRQRPLVMSAFNPAHVKSYFSSLHISTLRLQARWQRACEAGAFALEPDLMRYTVDVTSGLAFGIDTNTIESEGVIIQEYLKDIFRMLQKRMLAPIMYWHWIRFAEDRKLERDLQIVHKTVRDFIQMAQLRMDQNPDLYSQPTNLLEAMIAARDEEGKGLSDNELAGNVLTMLLAGEDTTAHTLAWFIYLIYRHPMVLEKLRIEINAILRQDAVPSRHEQLAGMEYMECCIQEVMRLKPVAPLIASEACHDTVVGGIALPKGAQILMLVRSAAVKEDNFVFPQSFEPERWLQPSSQQNNKKVSVPFGSGPRICPGRYLALEEMKMVIAMLVQNFDLVQVDTPNGQEPKEHLSFTMAPHNLHIALFPRKNREQAAC